MSKTAVHTYHKVETHIKYENSPRQLTAEEFKNRLQLTAEVFQPRQLTVEEMFHQMKQPPAPPTHYFIITFLSSSI